MCVCVYAYLSCTSDTVVVYIQYVCPCLHDSACARACGVSTGCLGARGAGGALQGGLGEASGEGSDAGVCQRGGREQLVPAADCGGQVQVLEEDLGHSHEALVVHTPVIPPNYYLQEREMRIHYTCYTETWVYATFIKTYIRSFMNTLFLPK